MAAGKRPVPSRTRKLSPPAPMVLHPRECGRVGRRRTHPTPRAAHNRAALDAFPTPGRPRPTPSGRMEPWLLHPPVTKVAPATVPAVPAATAAPAVRAAGAVTNP